MTYFDRKISYKAIIKTAKRLGLKSIGGGHFTHKGHDIDLTATGNDKRSIIYTVGLQLLSN